MGSTICPSNGKGYHTFDILTCTNIKTELLTITTPGQGTAGCLRVWVGDKRSVGGEVGVLPPFVLEFRHPVDLAEEV